MWKIVIVIPICWKLYPQKCTLPKLHSLTWIKISHSSSCILVNEHSTNNTVNWREIVKSFVLCSLFCSNLFYFFMSNLILFLPSAGLDIGPISDDPSSLPQPNVNQSSRPLTEEQLDGILSPELDKMVTDGNSFVLLENLSRNLISTPTSNYYLFCSIPVWTWLRNRFDCIFWWLLILCCLYFVQVLFLANCSKSQVRALLFVVFCKI